MFLVYFLLFPWIYIERLQAQEKMAGIKQQQIALLRVELEARIWWVMCWRQAGRGSNTRKVQWTAAEKISPVTAEGGLKVKCCRKISCSSVGRGPTACSTPSACGWGAWRWPKRHTGTEAYHHSGKQRAVGTVACEGEVKIFEQLITIKTFSLWILVLIPKMHLPKEALKPQR